MDQLFETIGHSIMNLQCLNDLLFLYSLNLFPHCLLLPVRLLIFWNLVLLCCYFIHQMISLLYFLQFLFHFIYFLFSLFISIFLLVDCYYLFLLMHFIILYFKNCFCFINVNWKSFSKSRFYFIIDLIIYYLFSVINSMIFKTIAL